MAASAEHTWALLQQVERVAACMPGASITQRIDERHYKGSVAVRFGPANLTFRGELEIAALEPAERMLRLVGKGTDAAGGSGAAMDLTARVQRTDAQACELVGRSEVSLSGKAAAFGGRMAQSVSEQVLRQFAANFAAELEQHASSQAAAQATAAAAPTAAAPTAPMRATPMSGFGLLWGVLVHWLRSLFGSGAA